MIYAYLRVSTIAQDEENQKSGVDLKAQQLGVKIDKYVVDYKSGAKDLNERNLGKLIKKAKNGDIIIISEISRFARRLFILFRVLETLLDKGVKVYSVKDGYTLDGSIQSKILAFAFGMAAEIERDMISKRTKEALDLRKKMGIKLGRPKGSKTKNHKLNPYLKRISKWSTCGYSRCEIARKCSCTDKTLKRYMLMNNI